MRKLLVLSLAVLMIMTAIGSSSAKTQEMQSPPKHTVVMTDAQLLEVKGGLTFLCGVAIGITVGGIATGDPLLAYWGGLAAIANCGG